MSRTATLATAVLLLATAVRVVAQDKAPNAKYMNPPTLSTPRGYSHIVETRGGRTIYIAGQLALDRNGTVVGAGDFKAQTRQVFENLKAALAAAGATFDHVVKTNTYVTDMSGLDALREIRAGYYGENAPASTTVRVAGLARPEYLIEIEAIAVVPE